MGGLFALCTSILSIIVYLYHLMIPFNYNDDAKTMLFSWRISSISITAKPNFYRNKCVVLGKYLSKSLEINEKSEKLDMLPAIQYFDTDIGGLTVYVSITTKLDKNKEYFLNLFQKLIIKNDAFSKEIKLLWDLPSNEEVTFYRLKGITNTFKSVQMTSVNERKLSRHIKIHSGSVQVPTNLNNKNAEIDDEDTDSSSNNDNSEDERDEIGTSISPHKSSKEKKKHDFVVLNTKDEEFDDDIDLDDIVTPKVVTPKSINILHVKNERNEQYEHGFSLNSTTTEDLL